MSRAPALVMCPDLTNYYEEIPHMPSNQSQKAYRVKDCNNCNNNTKIFNIIIRFGVDTWDQRGAGSVKKRSKKYKSRHNILLSSTFNIHVSFLQISAVYFHINVIQRTSMCEQKINRTWAKVEDFADMMRNMLGTGQASAECPIINRPQSSVGLWQTALKFIIKTAWKCIQIVNVWNLWNF